MPTTFTKAYDKFSKDGFFELNSQLLYAQQIHQLQARARFLKQDKAEIACCRFHLKRVKLTPGRLVNADPEQVVRGVMRRVLGRINLPILRCCKWLARAMAAT